VSGIQFLDHLDAGATVLGDLINVRALHEAHTDVGVTQAVGRALVLIPVKLELCAPENPIEELYVVTRKDVIGGLGIFRL